MRTAIVKDTLGNEYELRMNNTFRLTPGQRVAVLMDASHATLSSQGDNDEVPVRIGRSRGLLTPLDPFSTDTDYSDEETARDNYTVSVLIGDKPVRISIRDLIGRGGFGRVYAGVGSDGNEYALKFIKYDDTPDLHGLFPIEVVQMKSTKLSKVQKEYEINRDVQELCDHIVPVYAMKLTQGVAVLVMPRMKETLRDYIRRNGALSFREVVRIGLQIARTLSCLYTYNYAHHDLKPSNILLDANGNAYLGDFGLATIDCDKQRLSGKGTPVYQPPEILLQHIQRTFGPIDDCKGDAWSFGFVLYNMATGNFIRHEREQSLRDLYNRYATLQPRDLPGIGLIDPRLAQLIYDLLEIAPSNRPTYYQIVERLSMLI